jgi:hypothetical protein
VIKAEAMQKSTIVTNGSTNGSGKQVVLISEIYQEEVDNINVIKKNI